MNNSTEWVAVDWGTSNLRAWGIDAAGGVTFSLSSDQGMGKLQPADYPGVLTGLLGGRLSPVGPPIDVLIAGMAGARQGWLEAPYLEAPANLSGLLASAVRPALPGSRFRPAILPGICQKAPEDVMRGEEIQLLGLTALLPGFSGLVVMPGTHSKWAALEGARLTRFTTIMTGELYEVLRTHSVLRHSLPGDLSGADQQTGFTYGAEMGLAHPSQMTARLFQARSAALLSGRSSAWCAGFLSGLLIGTEIGGQSDWPEQAEIPLVGGIGLCELYGKVFALVGRSVRVVSATDATLAGLKLARNAL